MKKHYLLGTIALLSIGFLSLQKSGVEKVEKFLAKNGHTKFAAGAPTGKTGAPGESNCTDCHTGTTQDGTGQNILTLLDGGTPVTNYIPGTTYNVSLGLSSGNVMEGFQATVLDLSLNNMAGSFPGTGGVGTAISSASGRDYANHTATSNTEGQLGWLWSWDAPATDVGPVKFYVATNIANGNAGTGGDIIYLSEHTFGSSAGLEDLNQEATDFTAGYTISENKIVMNFTTTKVGNMHLNLVDLNGKSVFAYDMGESSLGENNEAVVIPNSLKSGIYVVNFFIGNTAMSDKIMIQK